MTTNLVHTTDPAPITATDRDNAGRFVAGHRNPGPGRPKKETEQAILRALADAFTEEEIKAHMREAMQIAIDQKSARGIVSVLELQAAYAVGRPTVRIEQPPDAWNELLRSLGQDVGAE